jgi:anti-sigma regulatory factor (Ser/Thr protein kinase)
MRAPAGIARHPAADPGGGGEDADQSCALLLASELVANSVEHSGSAVAGGVVTVIVAVGDKVVRVEVTDRSGDGIPVLRPAFGAAGGSVGYQRGGGLATIWFELALG